MPTLHYSPIIANLMLIQLYVLNLMHGGNGFFSTISWVLIALSASAILTRLLRLFTIKKVVIVCQFIIGIIMLIGIVYFVISFHSQMKKSDQKISLIGGLECLIIVASFIIEMKLLPRKKNT